MLLVRSVILIFVFEVVWGTNYQGQCLFRCRDRRPLALCAYNGRCKFLFESRCDLDYYNCQYTGVFSRFFPLWTDVCGNSVFTSCPMFYDTRKHKYFPLPLEPIREFEFQAT